MIRHFTATIATIGLCLLTVGCGGGREQGSASTGTPQPSSMTTSSPTSTTATPVAEAALDSLLLNTGEIDAAVGATGMTIVARSTSLADDIKVPRDAPQDKIACVGIAGTAEAQAYAGSGSTAVRDQLLRGTGDGGRKLTAGQTVVLFPSAGQAADFFAASAERWPACRQFTVGGAVVTVGQVSNNNGMLGTSFSSENQNDPDSVCGRALTVSNNVAVEASVCGAGVELATKIASQIADRAASH